MTLLKSKFFVLVLISCFFLLQGCIPSLHSLYTEDTLVSLDEIIGTWGENGSEEEGLMITTAADEEGMYETWNFEKDGEKRYRLIQIDDNGQRAAFQVHFVKLGDDIFADFFPDFLDKESKGLIRDEMYPSIPEINGLLFFHNIPVHTFAKVEFTEEKLDIKMFNYDYISKLFEKNRIRLKHEVMDVRGDESIVLTASTEELQKFVAKYADEPEAFTEGTALARKF